MAEPDIGAAGVIPRLAGWNYSEPLHPYYLCDVFTSHPLQGNQLGVFTDGRPLSGDDMQKIARELNIAETVFLLPPKSGGDIAMRIFTPATELPFAGHPVLGTGFVVAAALGVDTVILETGAGNVPVALEREADRVVFGWMAQPLPVWGPYENTEALLRALGVEESLLPIEIYHNGPRHVFVRLSSEQAVASLRPDMAELADLDVGANCFAGAGQRWKTRMFYPGAGVPEDPATGSAAGPLAVHLCRHGEIDFGEQIEIRQGEEIARPSELHVRVQGAGDTVDTVEVGGSAVIVAEGRYRISG